MFSIFVCNFHFLEEFTFVVVFQYFYLCCPHISMELGQNKFLLALCRGVPSLFLFVSPGVA